MPVDSAIGCSTQLPKLAMLVGQRERELVAPGLSASPISAPSVAPGIWAAGTMRSDAVCISLGAVEAPRAAGRRSARRAPARSTTGPVAAPDVVGVEEHGPEPVLARHRLERGPRVGDRDELHAVGRLVPEEREWLSVSVVPPDLLATMNRVRSSSSSPATRSIVAGCVVSSTMSSSAPSANPNVRREDLGARGSSLPIPSEHRGLEPVRRRLLRERLELADPLVHQVDDREPAETVGDLGRVVLPDRVVLAPDAFDDPVAGPSAGGVR